MQADRSVVVENRTQQLEIVEAELEEQTRKVELLQSQLERADSKSTGESAGPSKTLG